MTLKLDPSLDPTPIEDSAGLVTWAEKGSDVNRIRILIPAKVYTQRGAETDFGPYAIYLKTLVSQGAKFSNQVDITIDGDPASLVTVKAKGDLIDGDIGCSSLDVDQTDPDHCFAFGPDFTIRIVHFVHNGTTIVAWARTDPSRGDPAFDAAFKELLSTVHFT